MTREETRKRAEVMLAYAEGKTIEASPKGQSKWYEFDGEPNFYWGRYDYRVKPEPTYRPFKDKEECWAEMQKHQPFGWVINKSTKAYQSIVILGESGYEHLFQHLAFVDGTPFGIKED